MFCHLHCIQLFDNSLCFPSFFHFDVTVHNKADIQYWSIFTCLTFSKFIQILFVIIDYFGGFYVYIQSW